MAIIAGERPADTSNVSDQADLSVEEKPSHWWRGTLAAGGVYLLCSLYVWWNIWSTHPASTTNCSCNDTGTFIWVLEWPVYALSHGHNIFYSASVFHGTGFNLLSNTGIVGIGIVLAPVTWMFGPVFALNVALALAPVLSALAVFVLLRRWVTWTFAAFAGGLLYGFSPFVLHNLSVSQLQLGMLAVPPLIVLTLDELLIRQRWRPVRTGILLGLLVALQFLIGSEILAMFTIVTVACLILMAVYWLRKPDRNPTQGRHAITGLVAGGVTTLVALAYPAWFALAGPAALRGRVWDVPLSSMGLSLATLANPTHTALDPFTGQPNPFTGATFSPSYIGVGLVIVCLAGIIVWRRDRRLWLCASAIAISLILSVGVTSGVFLPWQALANLPLMQNVIPSRFVAVTYLATGLMFGLILDHCFVATRDRLQAERSGTLRRRPRLLVAGRPASAAAAVGAIVAAVALVPIVLYLTPSLPLGAQPVVFPQWFKRVAPHLSGRQVLFILPTPAFLEGSMAWQAMDHMQYSMAFGSWPGADPSRAGAERAGVQFLDSMSGPFFNSPVVNPSDIFATRQAMKGWGVTTIVIPTDGQAPAWQWRVISVPDSVAVMTVATGMRPVLQDDSWVWSGVEHAGPPVILSTAAFNRCTALAADGQVVAIDAMNSCLLSPPRN